MKENTKVEGKKISLVSFIAILLNAVAIICMIVSICDTYIPKKRTGNKHLNYVKFNNIFTVYEGIRTGSQIKQLIETVNVNNINNDGTNLVVTINRMDNTNQYLFRGVSKRKYKVEIEKDNDTVSNINIYTMDEEDNNKFAEIIGELDGIGKKEGGVQVIDFPKVKTPLSDTIIMLIIVYFPNVFLYFTTFLYYRLKKKKILKEYDVEESKKSIIKLKKNVSIMYIIIAVLIMVALILLYLKILFAPFLLFIIDLIFTIYIFKYIPI